MNPVASTCIIPDFLKSWSVCDDPTGTGNQGAQTMFQFIHRFSNWIFLPAKTTAITPPRPIRFGSTKSGGHPSSFSQKSPHVAAALVPASSVAAASVPFKSGGTTFKPSSARPQMELLEARATPAHLGGMDIRMGLVDSALVLRNSDWLAQPITRSFENSFLTMGAHCPKIENTTVTCVETEPQSSSLQKFDTLLFSKPQESFHATGDFTLSRDELFQTGEWGSANNRADVFALWTETHGNQFVTHGAKTPDALLMASLAVVGVPLLSMSEKPEEHWEEVLPGRAPKHKKSKPSFRKFDSRR